MSRKRTYLCYFFLINNILGILCLNNTRTTKATKTLTSESKISGGYRGDVSKWGKYTASIRRINSELKSFGTGHFCGGSIISRRVILTASHCLFNILKDSSRSAKNSFGLYVVVGTTRRLFYTQRTQVLDVKSIVLHPDYDPLSHHNDIALIIVTDKIVIDGDNTAIIALPEKPPKESLPCTVAGWGAIYYHGPKPDEIVYASLILETEDKCRQKNPTMSKREICANSPNDKVRDTCQGDSGGPLFCDGAVYGVVSRGIPCGLFDDSSGIYTNVFDYVDWIQLKSANKSPKFIVYEYFWIIYIVYGLL